MSVNFEPLHQAIPQCVGFIMDGNRRWAKERNQPTVLGHQAGKEVFDQTIVWIQELAIPHAVYYAFSTENWQRAKEEVTYLMNLFTTFITSLLSATLDQKVRVRFVGERSHFSAHLQSLMAELEDKSAIYTQTTVWVALSYGGRAEIVLACNQAIERGVPIDEDGLAKYLYTSGMPDPDIIIRTSGEMRLSNFLPWQSVYSELFFTDTYWPAFTKDEFTRIVSEYGDRQRRRGK